MFRPIRIGVMGVGRFGQLHARTLLGLAEAELVALVGRERAELDRLPEALRDAPAWTDADAAIREADAEAWIIASSTATHVPLARQVLAAGQAVLIEKPLSMDLGEAASLAPLLARGEPCMMGHITLFNSEFRALAEEAARRGPIRHLTAARHRTVDHIELYPGESPFHLLMVHDLYMALALLGDRDPVHISAQRHRHTGGGTDLGLAQLQWDDGTLASFTASFMVPAGQGGDGLDRMELFGAGWMAAMQPNPRPLVCCDTQRAAYPLTLEIGLAGAAPSGMLAEELRCFCRVVRGIESIPRGARYEDAMRVMRWIEALDQAAP